MGENKRKTALKRPIDVLFGSSVRVDVLSQFLLRPQPYFTLSDLVKYTGRSYTGVGEALKDLVETVKIIKADFPFGSIDGSNLAAVGRNLERDIEMKGVKYLLNKKHPWLPALSSLFENTFGSLNVLREELNRLISIDVAFVYGSFARNEQGPESDLDVIIIGHQTRRTLSSHISRIEKRLGRQIDLRTYTPDEWRNQYDAQNHFVRSLMSDRKIFMVGDNEKLEFITTG